MSLYRDAGAEVVSVLSRAATRCEKASVDEVYVDVTLVSDPKRLFYERARRVPRSGGRFRVLALEVRRVQGFGFGGSEVLGFRVGL
eukprot:2476451-Pyramimonas_sp.AAC.1